MIRRRTMVAAAVWAVSTVAVAGAAPAFAASFCANYSATFNPSNYTYISSTSGVVVTGTQADPLRATSTTQVTSDITANAAKVNFAGPSTTLTISYWSAVGTAAQQIFFTGLSFTNQFC